MQHFKVWLVTLDKTLVSQLYRQLIANILANIDGAVRVHDLSTWPENQRLFVFCTEPVILAEDGGLCGLPKALAYA